MEVDLATVLVRLVNAVLWSVLVLRAMVRHQPFSILARQIIGVVILFGMWSFVFGAMTAFDLPGSAARVIYTAFTAFSAIVAIAMLTTDEPGGR